jgi:hypothetical protein
MRGSVVAMRRATEVVGHARRREANAIDGGINAIDGGSIVPGTLALLRTLALPRIVAPPRVGHAAAGRTARDARQSAAFACG